MSLIDWSDPEEMFGLLVEYIGDEQTQAAEPGRREFLARLRKQLEALQEPFEALPLAQVINALRAIHHSIASEFENDSVVEHLSACIEELERVHTQKP